MIEWDTVKGAIAAWVLAATGLPPGRAIWSQQGGDRPSPAFVEMRFARVRGIGLDWQEVVEVLNANLEHLNSRIFSFLDYAVVGTR